MSESWHLDEGTIHAWLDGALAPDESARIEGHITSCAACSAAVAEARGVIAASSRILSALDDVPAGVLPGRDQEGDQLAALRHRHRLARGPWWRQRQVLAAASLLLVAGTSTVVWRATQDGTVLPTVDVTSPDPASGAAVEPPRRDPVAAPAVPPNETRAALERPIDVTTNPSPTPPAPSMAGAARRAEGAAESKVLQDAAAKKVEVSEQAARETRDMAASQRAVDSQSLQRMVPLPLQQQGGARQDVDAARLRSLSRAAAPGVSNALGLATIAPGATGTSSLGAPSNLPVGCFELRGPDPVGVRLLGVPDGVRLLADSVVADPGWRNGESLDSSMVQVTLRWRMADPVTVELRVFRPLDSTVVRFRTPATAEAFQRGGVPSGTMTAVASRIVCR